MTFDFNKEKELTIDMTEYVASMLEEFSVKLDEKDVEKYQQNEFQQR